MIKDIKFADTDKKVRVQIDNEVNELPIKSIIKLPTYIIINTPIKAALKDNIDIDATLCYIADKDDEEETVKTELDLNNITAFQLPNNKVIDKINTNGIVTIKIYDNDNTYYEENIRFTNGDIKTSIPHDLSIGEYKCDIIYEGNKYYEPYTLTINFNVERRLAKCIFTSTKTTGQLKETLSISGILKDSNTNALIQDCVLNFDFDGKTYSTLTNKNGIFTINPTIPDGNILHCNPEILEEETIVIEIGEPYEEEYDEELRDEDGNIVFKYGIEDEESKKEDTEEEIVPDIYSADEEKQDYQNTSYLIDFSLNSDSYYLENTSLTIVVTKAPTYITINTGAYDKITKKINFNGFLLAKAIDALTNVHYGKVQIEFPDFNYIHDLVKVDTHGLFSTDINMADAYASYNNTDIDEMEIYQGYNSIYDTAVIIDEDTKTKIKKGEPISTDVKIKTITNEIVTDGMVRFNLYYEKEEDPVYQYATELDTIGFGGFNFNTSRTGEYTLVAQYKGLFGYKNSENQITIKVSD